MKKLLDKILPSIPYDKKLHFLAGALIAILGGVIIDPITGIGLAIAVWRVFPSGTVGCGYYDSMK